MRFFKKSMNQKVHSFDSIQKITPNLLFASENFFISCLDSIFTIFTFLKTGSLSLKFTQTVLPFLYCLGKTIQLCGVRLFQNKFREEYYV